MHFQIAVIGGRIRAIRERTLQRLLTGVCTNVDYQNTPRHRGVFAIRVGTLVRLLARVGADVDLHVTLSDGGVVAAVIGAVVSLRSDYLVMDCTAVVVATTCTNGLRFFTNIRLRLLNILGIRKEGRRDQHQCGARSVQNSLVLLSQLLAAVNELLLILRNKHLGRNWWGHFFHVPTVYLFANNPIQMLQFFLLGHSSNLQGKG